MNKRGRRLTRMWGGRVNTWHQHVMASEGFDRIREQVLALAEPGIDDDAVDLGAGTGFVTLPLAEQTRSVIAVDVAPQMTSELEAAATRQGLTNVAVRVADLAEFDLPEASIDIVVSNYALHHLEHADKQALLVRARRWLRPGGRIVIADMMFGRGATAHDRRVLASKSVALLRKGPGGVWRIVKNLFRFGLGVGSERPASPQFWLEAFKDAGFDDARFVSVVAEAGIVVATVHSSKLQDVTSTRVEAGGASSPG